MFKKILWSSIFMALGLASSASATEVTGKMIEYSGTNLTEKYEGYLVIPKGITGSMPALLVVHNWMGLTAETKKQSERFAKLGYVVFAVDIYGKNQRPKDTNEAGGFATKYKTDRKLFRERLNLGLARLLEEKTVNKDKIAVAGYCFGGTGAIELARSGASLKGVLSFHGGLDSPSPTDGQNIKAKLLVLHGAIDPYVAEKDIAAFEAEMKSYKVDYQLIKYSETVHSFTEQAAGTDITKGAAYNETSDRRSFRAAQNFLKEIF